MNKCDLCTMKFCRVKMILRSAIFLLFILSGTRSEGQNTAEDTVHLTLNGAWERANTFSNEIQLKNIDNQIGLEDLKQAKSQWLPHVGASAHYGKLSNIPVFEDGILESPTFIPIHDHSTYEAGVEAEFNLYNGHKNHLAIKKAETKTELLQYIQSESVADIHYKVAELYLSIQRSTAFVKLIKQDVNRNKKRLEQIQQLYDNGVILKSDLLRAQLQLSQQETNLLKMTNNLNIAIQQLNIIMGYDDNHPLKPTDDIAMNLQELKQAYQNYIDIALSTSHYEKMAEAHVKLSELDEKNIKADKLPRISLFGEYSYSFPQIMLYPYADAPYAMGVGGIRISYNISSLYHDRHKENAASLTVDRQKLAKAQTEEKLRTQINTAYKRLNEDLTEIEVAALNIEQAKENDRIINETYFNQLALITDLLEADTQLLKAQFDLINSQISARLHYYQLLRLTGQL